MHGLRGADEALGRLAADCGIRGLPSISLR